MGRNSKVNPFAQRKRDKRYGKAKPDKRSEPYQEIVRENKAFSRYYQIQNICPESEWDSFLTKIQSDLPTTFRLTAFRDQEKALLEIIKTEFAEEYTKAVSELRKIDGEEVTQPIILPWYPNELGWQLHLTRKDIRRSEPLSKLHNFLIAETNVGAVNRQEAVSMIPPIVLDVQPTDKVLDMCAAPGSKTAQLIEALHATKDSKYSIPSGFIVANDIDNNRCYMLVHQAKRLNSPCFIVTNHDSSVLPNIVVKDAAGDRVNLKFDKVLCDVPCSGDGTLRKNPDIWLKWTTHQCYHFNGIQYRIARRGAELLAVGGRLVYSTCSLNPIENEAVLQRLIQNSDGALEIVDASHMLPGLQYRPGLTNWKLISKDNEVFTDWKEVPEKYHTVMRPYMLPLPPDEIKDIGLDKCIRILPHLQDTGAFFVAVLIKKKPLEWEKRETAEENETKVPKNDSDNVSAKVVPWGPQRKRFRLNCFKEDPFIFFADNEPIWDELKEFYELDDSFDKTCLLTRTRLIKKKNIYFCSPEIRDIVLFNEDNIKIINTGVKMFSRCDNKNMKCNYRLAQEGLSTSNLFIGQGCRLNIDYDDLLMLLYSVNPIQPQLITGLSEITQEKITHLKGGSCVLTYVHDDYAINLVGWKGSSSLRAYIELNETIHTLRILRADVSRFEINKFKKEEEQQQKQECEEIMQI